MAIKKHIPNLLTLVNLLFGCLSIKAIFSNDLSLAAIFIGVAALFDLLDGLAARLLNATSGIGKELDSLADIVSFGVAPGFILWKLLQMSDLPEGLDFLQYIAFLVPLFSALRLAKFNLDDRQTESFLGLPVPANAIFIASLPLVYEYSAQEYQWVGDLIGNPWFLIAVILVFSLLLVSEVPLISLKFKSFGWKGNQTRMVFLILSIILIIVLQYVAIPLIIIIYFVISVVEAYLLSKRK